MPQYLDEQGEPITTDAVYLDEDGNPIDDGVRGMLRGVSNLAPLAKPLTWLAESVMDNPSAAVANVASLAKRTPIGMAIGAATAGGTEAMEQYGKGASVSESIGPIVEAAALEGALPSWLGGTVQKGMRAAGSFLKGQAPRLYESAIKPTEAALRRMPAFRTGGEEAARKEFQQVGLRVGLRMKGGPQKARSLFRGLTQQVDDILDAEQTANPGYRIDPRDLAKGTRRTAEEFANQNLPMADRAKVSAATDEFLTKNPRTTKLKTTPVQKPTGVLNAQGQPIMRTVHKVTGREPRMLKPSEVQRLKKGTYRRKGKRYAQEQVDSASDAMSMALASAEREALEQFAPAIAPLNARASQVAPFQKILAQAGRRVENRDPIGLSPMLALVKPTTGWMNLLNVPAITERAAFGAHGNTLTGEVANPTAQTVIRALLLKMLGQDDQEP